MRTTRTVCLQGGSIIDGSGAPPVVGDILFCDGKIIASGAGIEPPEEAVCIPIHGLYVSPGWIDLHTHVFDGTGIFSVAPCEIGLQCGVTTLVDAGSAGALTLEGFVKHGIRQARERVLAYVNISSGGLIHGHPAEPGFYGEHFRAAAHSIELAEGILKRFPDDIVGWKARLTAVLADDPNCNAERSAWETILAVRERTGRPVMVHHVESSIPPEEIVARLNARDVFTHLYHGLQGSIFEKDGGKPIHAALEARERGVIFDVGHGCGSFRWGTAEAACRDHGFWPDTISSDLHRYNLFSPVRDLATTMSKFLYLGASLQAVIAMCTENVQRVIMPEHQSERMLAVGQPADLTLFRVEHGRYDFQDAAGDIRVGSERIVPLAVAREGALSPCYGFHSEASSFADLATALQRALTL